MRGSIQSRLSAKNKEIYGHECEILRCNLDKFEILLGSYLINNNLADDLMGDITETINNIYNKYKCDFCPKLYPLVERFVRLCNFREKMK